MSKADRRRHLERPGDAERAICELRRELCISRKEFAWRVGFSVAYVRNIEAGTKPLRVSMAIAWAHALQCDPAPLVRAAVQDQLAAAGEALAVTVEMP